MKYTSISTFTILFGLSACSANFDSTSVQATAGAPTSAQVAEVSVPYDRSAPTYVLAVEKIVAIPSIQKTVWEVDEINTKRTSGSRSRRLERSVGESDDMKISGKSNTQSGSETVTYSRDGSPSNQQQASGMAVRPATHGGGGGMAASHSATRGGSATETDTSVGRVRRQHENEKENWSSNQKVVDSRKKTTEKSSYTIKYDERQRQITAQLRSALSNIQNFSLLDYGALEKKSNGLYGANIQAGEKGPYVVRAKITEYESNVEEKSTSGTVLGLVSGRDRERVGIVALDVAIVDGNTGRIVTSFPVRGTFREREKRQSGSVILASGSRRKLARSVLDQALRVAINDAAKRAFDELSTRVP